MKKKTLAQIIESGKKNRVENGCYGIIVCKVFIKFMEEHSAKSLYQQLEEYVIKANEDPFFNDLMVLACWELINEDNDEEF